MKRPEESSIDQTAFQPESASERLLSNIESSGRQLSSGKFLRILTGKYSGVLQELINAARAEQAGERFKSFNLITQRLIGKSKEEGLEVTEREFLTQLGSFASFAARASRDEKITISVNQQLELLSHQAEQSSRESEVVMNNEFNSFLAESIPVDSGANAVVFRLSLKERSQEFVKVVVQEGIEENSKDSALKVLKIYRKGEINLEYDRQSKAYTALNKKFSTGKSTAIVPRPQLFKEIKLADPTEKHLEAYDCHPSAGRAEILMMDFIEGRDFQYYILRKVLEIKGVDIDFEKFDSYALYSITAEEFEFLKTPPGASAGERWEARAANMSFVYKFLEKNNVKINPAIISQLREGVKGMHEAGVIHGDLHERNLMYEGSIESFFSSDPSKVGQSFIIDFGPIPAEEQEFINSDQDFIVPNRLADLNKS